MNLRQPRAKLEGLEMSKHTAGPWKVGEDQGTSLGFEIVDKRDDPIAWTSPHRPQQDANARLIAAAPEMYDWLVKVRQIAEQQSKGRNDIPLHSAWQWLADNIQDVLAKAEGK